MRTKTAVLLLAVLSSMSVCADEPVALTRFLVPLYQDRVAGAYGSVWETSTWVLYTGRDGAFIVPRPGICEVLCPGLGGLFPPNQAPKPLFAEVATDTGVLVSVPEDQASDFAFGSRVRDVSRNAESAGTEVPVVPEDQIVGRNVSLFDVQLGPRMRNTLRIYALPEVAAPEVEVRFYRWPIEYKPDHYTDAIELLAERRVALHQPERIEGMFLFPSFAVLGNFDAMPELAGESSVWIDVVPLTSGLRIWGMVSMTNNDTQQLTLVTPHRHQ